jgi:hypothetical protein
MRRARLLAVMAQLYAVAIWIEHIETPANTAGPIEPPWLPLGLNHCACVQFMEVGILYDKTEVVEVLP